MVHSQLYAYLLCVFTHVTMNSEFMPQFEDADTETITVTEGDTAVIRCKIAFLNNE